MKRFVFPPPVTGLWRDQDAGDRKVWLRAACTLHFENAARGRVAPRPDRTIVLEGSLVDGLLGFFCAMGEAVNGPGGYFGSSFHSFDDCLFGGFGLDYPYTIIWEGSAESRPYLGSEILHSWLEEEREGEDPFPEIAASWAEGADTMFDVLVHQMQSVSTRGHGSAELLLR